MQKPPYDESSMLIDFVLRPETAETWSGKKARPPHNSSVMRSFNITNSVCKMNKPLFPDRVFHSERNFLAQAYEWRPRVENQILSTLNTNSNSCCTSKKKNQTFFLDWSLWSGKKKQTLTEWLIFIPNTHFCAHLFGSCFTQNIYIYIYVSMLKCFPYRLYKKKNKTSA